MKVKQPIKHYGDYDKDAFLDPKELAKYKNKSVIIFGSGNAAYELANILTPLSSTIAIVGRNQKKWAMSTHYVGDLRSVYLPFVDTFLLKSLNSFSDEIVPKVFIDQQTEDGPYFISGVNPMKGGKMPFFSNPVTSVFDHVLFCTGWKFDPSIFQFPIELTHGGKYPEIQINYESTNQQNLFFVGSLGHSLDFKRSSGGFIHGFRYLLTHFMNMNYKLPYEITYFSDDSEDPLKDLVFHIMTKINTSSPMYQMYGQICDFYIFDSKEKKIVYYNNIHTSMITEGILQFEEPFGFVISLEYGNEPVTDIHKLGKKVSNVGTESKSTLLHPVMRVIQKDLVIVDIIHFDEDLFANFTKDETYLHKLVRVIKSFL
jgi:hypothetical protein